jgi:hypothetical protein
MSDVDVFTPSDPIIPSKLEHLVEEGYDLKSKTQLFHYNFLRYAFEHPAGEIWARSYLDSAERVDIYLPKGVTFNDPIVQKVVGYLRRRFREVHRPGPTSYESI